MKFNQWILAGLCSAIFLMGPAGQSAAQTQTKKPVAKPAVRPAAAQKPASPAQTVKLTNAIDSVSYSIGMNVGTNLKQQNLSNANLSAMMKGMEDALQARNSQISPEQANVIIQTFFQQQYMAKADVNKKAGEKFLEENKKKPGIVTTSSGLQYQIVKEGTGPKPTAKDTVKTHYTGRLIDGTVFDSSVERGEPIEFPVTGVIQGWVEALQLMPVGSKWKLFIPAALAYGERGSGPVIGPQSTLIFDIELLEIVK